MTATSAQTNGAGGRGELQKMPSSGGGGLQSLKFRKLASGTHLNELEFQQQQKLVEDQRTFEDLQVQAEQDGIVSHGSLLKDILDVSPLLVDTSAAIVDDSFTRCFKSQPSDPWNWNFYLLPLWAVGVVVRHFVLFPLRLLFLLTCFLIFFICFGLAQCLKAGPTKASIERSLCMYLCAAFTASWTAVIRYHGPKPVPRANHVWVANHTSMIDYVVLCSYTPFAVIMQLHPGWVGFLQTKVLNSLGCLWFKRTEVKDRKLVAERMKAHVQAADTTPLLIFPEGTCVNNEYCVMFKRGAFDLGATVCPVAIKYNKIFVDAFWNSRRQSFTAHLGKLMRSWAVVCDVYFLEPTSIQPGESSSQFAERVQRAIAERAKLRIAPWDGYLKYYNLAEKHPDLVQRRQKMYAEQFKQKLAMLQTGAQGKTRPLVPSVDGTQ